MPVPFLSTGIAIFRAGIDRDNADRRAAAYSPD
jgi:hypothetical protein